MLKAIKYLRPIIASLGIALFLWSHSVYALDGLSAGDAADNMLVPMAMFTEGFYKLCYIIGGMLIFGAGIQYKNHRNTPGAVRLSTPIVLLLLGLAFVLLPFIGMTSVGAQVVSAHA